MMKKRFKGIQKLITLLITAIAVSFAFVFGVSKAYAADERENAGNYTFYSDDAFISYAIAFNNNGYNAYDTITLNQLDSTYWNLPTEGKGFTGLGTSSRPFRGKIIITDSAVKEFYLEAPLLNYATTEAKIVKSPQEGAQTQTITIRRIKSNTNPILIGTLKYVEGYSTNLSVISAHNAMDSDNELVCNTGSVIGTIENNADVTVSFENNNTHNSIKSNMSSANDIGMIAGTVGNNVTLTISSLGGSNTDFDITTTGNDKAAGGLVGRMGIASSLIMPASFSSITTVNAVNGYAGGIIGYSNSSIVNIDQSTVVINKNITGGYSTGGIFGYYENTDGAKTFDLKNVTISSTSLIKSQKEEGATGGIFGTLISDYSINITDSTTNIENDTDYKIKGTINGNGTYKSGSLIGYYSNSSLTNTLSIYNEKVNTSVNAGLVAGLIGKIDDSNPAYIDIHNVRVKTASGAFDAGLINDMGNAGSFLDLSNSVIIKGNVKDGIVDLLNEGVIRFKGTTDLSEISYEASAAQLVGHRGNGLIYALGSGGSESNWIYKRRSSSQDNIYVDDIGDWGQVLRIEPSYNTLNESDFFTVDDTNHTVTLEAHVSDMGDIVSFIRTALNIQLNIEDKGALKFSSSSRSSTILSSNLSITGNINLIHTGIVSLQRDNGESDFYTGTFSGNGKTVYLALGEAYGVVNGSTKTEANNGYNYYGTVHDHHYMGLFANTNNATLTNVTIDGFIHSKASSTNFGPLAASIKSTSSSTISNITSKTAIYSYARGGAANVGGVIGRINDSSTGTISISNITAENSINEIRTNSGGVRYGGVIATIDSVSTLIVNLDTINLKGTFTNTSSSTYSSFVYGGLIGFIKQDRGNLKRTINLTNITVSNGFNATYKTTSGSATASILGGTWHDALVYFGTTSSNGITINNTSSSITVNSGSSNSRMGVLVGRGSGKWYVNDINVTNLTVTSNVSSKLGFIVYDAYTNVDTAYSGLYLIVKRSDFDIASTVFNGTYSTFDEICGNSIITTDGNILSNGQAIISLENASNAELAMDGSNCNTYQNVTAYGKTNHSINPSTRYYYNVDCILNKNSKTDADKFFIWSIKSYAHSTIASLFTGGFTNTNITGTLDMTGYSYYPINIAQTVTISSASIKFVNSLIEASEAGSGNTDSTVRSTHIDNKSQHYMMHEGMFINVTGTLSINTLSIAGDISNYDSRSGFIALGTIGGLESSQTTISLSNITLDGAKVTFKGGTTDAPLLLNRILKNTSITLNGCVASEHGYDSFTYPAASSLFGDAGDSLATNINLTFSSLTLDSRTSTGSLISTYHTTRSLFSKATLLNSLVYVNGQAVYNFERSEDWGSGYQVTYGYELTGSVEYNGKESMYYNDTTYYVSPVSGTATSAFDFSSGYLPYVFTPSDQANKYHEVRVNVKDSAEISGCGKYNDPYIIETNQNYTGSELLNAIANIIKGTPTNGTKITLPDDLIADNNAWCSDSSADHLYTYSGTAFERTDDPSKTKKLADVRAHLSKAYYLVTTNITLDDGYIGLGVLDANEDTYMFRGVIVGQNSNITITNNSSNPLVFASNGCVIKDLTVVVNKNIELTLAATSTLSPMAGSMPAYGALIGRVFGGDNIIDNVNVRYDKSITLTDDYSRLIPVGGYVGAVVSGGLIFRNMGGEGSNISGLPNSKCSYISNESYYYVNPIIGRVIAGYSFTETSNYVYNEASVTMKNGLKNYGICDINNSTENKISATGNSFPLSLTVPDAQSLFILSCIVNSGAGSASLQKNASMTAYSLGTSFLAGYRDTSETRTALYNNVGTTEPSAANVSDYQTIITYDKSNTGAKIPYIIKQYTNTDNGYYKARSVCGNGGSAGVKTITLSDITYYLPAGFRGIGGIYIDSNYYKLRFNSINGNNAEINFNMSYYEYDVTANGENYKAVAGITGFGLFNNMYHVSASDTNTIKDLTLSGSIVYDIRKRSDGNIIVYAPHTPEPTVQYYHAPYTAEDLIASNDTNLMSNSGVLNLGGLCGYLQGNTNIQNVSMNNLTINGAKFAGGLIGYSTGKAVTIKNPSATNINVTGGFAGGGLIGGFYGNGNLTITGEENAHAKININKVSVKGHAARAKLFNTDFGRNHKCAGALLGYVSTGTNYTLTIEYVDIINGTVTTDDSGYYNETYEGGQYGHVANLRYKCMVGGLCGEVRDSNLAIDEIAINEVNIRGEIAGGLFGYVADSVFGTIESVSLSNETRKTIDGTNITGGFIGLYVPSSGGNKSIVFRTITVSNYDILSSGQTAERCAAGGLLGLCYWYSPKNLSLENILLENIKVEKTNSYKIEKTEYLGFGGLAGTITNKAPGTAGSITGYNILLNNVTLNIQNQYNKPGILIGVNSATGECKQLDVKIAGISIQNTTGADEIVGTYRTVNNNKQYYGDYGYVVFADYSGISASLDDSIINKDHAFLYDSQNDYEEELPYVNVNSSVLIADDQLLTGDGMSKTKEGLVINDIVSANGTGYYAYSSQSLTDFNIGKLSTFNEEQYLHRSNDFGVLIVDETSRDKTTALVNAYLNLLANTKFDYGTNYSINNISVFDVDIYRMQYNEGTGTFTKLNTEANLKRADGKFYMLITDIDTSGIDKTFSLIDVKFKDPNDPTKVAYHLYVPVIVKKMFKYEFKIATGTGTTYDYSWYEDNNRFGVNLMENLGTPTTIYFEYEYERSKADWLDAIRNGENLIRNYDKVLSMQRISASNLDEHTVMVLVDIQNGGKPYYARFNNSVYSTNNLNLQRFKETLTANGSTGTAFAPIDLTDMLNITAAVSAEGTFMVDDVNPTIRAHYNGGIINLRLATESDSAGTRYTVDIDDGGGEFENVKERYYISFFTSSSDTNILYQYNITVPSTFGVSQYPSRLDHQDDIENRIRLIFGNIFVQEGFEVNTFTQEEITETNNTLNIEMKSTVSIASGVKDEVVSYLSTDVLSFYQSFLVMLEKREASSTTRIIAGEPNVNGRYGINSSAYNRDTLDYNTLTAYTSDQIFVSSNFIEFRNSSPLNSFLVVENGKAYIFANVFIEYDSLDNITLQFPNKTNPEDRTTGVRVFASSNLAFQPEVASFSKISITDDDISDKLYYCTAESDRAILYFDPLVDDQNANLGALGINPLDMEGTTQYVYGNAVLDLSLIIDKTYNNYGLVNQSYKYDSLRLTVQLTSKESSYDVANDALDIPTYMSDIWIKDINTNTSGYYESKTGNMYTFIIPRSLVENSANPEELDVKINFIVKTGQAFEGLNHYYSNYKITLTANLVNVIDNNMNNLDLLESSTDTNYIIYTNAKVIPDFVE